MRTLLALALLGLLLAGCTQPPAANTSSPTPQATPTPALAASSPTPASCTPAKVSLAAGTLPSGLVLSNSYTLAFGVSYEKGDCKDAQEFKAVNVTLKEGKQFLGRTEVLLPTANEASFAYLAADAGAHDLTASVDGSAASVSATVTVLPLGVYSSSPGQALKADRSNRFAARFTLTNPIGLSAAILRLRRMQDYPLGDFVVRVRPEVNGLPGEAIQMEAKRGLVILSKDQVNQTRLDFPTGSHLVPGAYWLTVEGTSNEQLEVFVLDAAANASQNVRTSGGMASLPSDLPWQPYAGQLWFQLTNAAA